MDVCVGCFLEGKIVSVPYLNISSLLSPTGDVSNEALEKVLKQVAKAALAETDGLTISPLINTDR